MEIGKKMGNIPKNVKINIMRHVKKNPEYEEFMDLLYFTIELEQGAIVQQLYGKLKYKKNIKTVEDLEKYYKEGRIYEIDTAYDLANCNLYELFNIDQIKNDQTGEFNQSKFELIVFFTLLKKIGKITNNLNDIENIRSFITKLLIEGSVDITESDLIDDNELYSTIKNYNNYFNKIGLKLIKKFDKMYVLILNQYKKKEKLYNSLT
jgi:hypothetical protein